MTNKTAFDNKIVFAALLIMGLSLPPNSYSQKMEKTDGKIINLLDDNLSHWYKWIGVPHNTIKGLPEGTPKGDGMKGIPLGRKDPKEVFTVITLNGEKVLRVSGEIYGGLNTNNQYGDYHLQVKYKWGSKKWEPRLEKSKDCGIMFHLTGTNENAFWSVFMMGLEFQVSENTTGDFFMIPNKDFTMMPTAEVRIDDEDSWNLKAPLVPMIKHFVKRSENHESKGDAWTTLDLYTVGRTAVYLVNGTIVNVVQNTGLKKTDGSIIPLDRGKIQLRSEGAEAFYKDITLEPIADFPEDIKEKAGLTPPNSWKLGVALYSFHKYNFPEQLATADSTGLKFVEGFTFSRAGKALNDSLIMSLSPSGIGKLNNLVQSKGMRMQSIYITGGNTVADWERDFKIAKKMNVQYVTAEPPVNMWDSVDSLAGKYGLKVAIHNHYKGKSPYWDPDSVLVALKDHPNFGACPDLGHYPKSGINPVDALKKLEGHIIAIHLKDIAAYNNPNLKDVPVGTGVIDFPKVFEELKRQNFNGHIIIERDAEDWPNNLSAINKAVRYVNKLLGLPDIESLEPTEKVRDAPSTEEEPMEVPADSGSMDDFVVGK